MQEPKQYKVRKYEKHSAKATSGAVVVMWDAIAFADSTGECRFQFDSIKIETAGADGKRIKAIDLDSGTTIICTDPGFLLDLQKADLPPHLREQINQTHTNVSLRDVNWLGRWVLLAIVVILCISVSWYSLNETSNVLSHLVPPSVDVIIGNKAIKTLIKEDKISETSKEVERINKIGKRLVAELDPEEAKKFEFHFYYKKDKEMNAFSLPGGNIIVCSKLNDALKSDDALAGVLGHELGHVVHRDMMRGVIQKMGLMGFVAVMAGKGGEHTDKLLLSTLELAPLSYNRHQEDDADAYAIPLTKKAGYKPDGLIEALEVLSKENPDGDDDSLWSNHPGHKSRIEHLRKLIKAQESD
jgi:predicted Zn-dependent protease